MHSELDFLIHIPILNNDDNRDSVYNWVRGGVDFDENGNLISKDDPGGTTVIFKGTDVNNTKSLKNYYKTTVDAHSDISQGYQDINPYLKLIRDFATTKDGAPNIAFQSMRFLPADLAYLTDLGVYPMNRMWVLRRFAPGVTVPGKNLQDWGGGEVPEPTNTIVGWIDPTADSFFDFSFNEKWETITDRLDQVLGKILKEEFGFNSENVIPLPGFSQGLMFGFMNEMGLTDYDINTIPQGDPAVLQEAASRAVDSNPGFGLTSGIELTLKTSYEQKFIGDIDPGSAMVDIIQNCIYMGTRDVKKVFNAGHSIFQSLKEATNGDANSVDLWWKFIQSIVTAFTNAINKMLEKFKTEITKATTEETKSNTSSKAAADKSVKDSNDSSDKIFWNSYTADEKETNGPTYAEFVTKRNYSRKQNATKPKETTTEEKPVDKTAAKEQSQTFEKGKDAIAGMTKFLTGEFAQSILASTVAKWRFALIGSVALMTGENSTPWHITLGNPYSPFVTLGNVKITNFDMKFNNEFSYNDIPTRLDVEIKVSLGRNMGAQELFRMFNNGYQRAYTPSTTDTKASETSEEQKKQTKSTEPKK